MSFWIPSLYEESSLSDGVDDLIVEICSLSEKISLVTCDFSSCISMDCFISSHSSSVVDDVMISMIYWH